jgi:membrane fusion protein, multidrug efflux system
MNIRRIFKTTLFISAISMILISCGSSKEQNSDAENDSQAKAEAVRVQEIGYSEIARTFTQTAQLQAFREVHYAPAAPGRIEKIHAEIGQKVTEGQLLVEMDRTQLNQALLQLQSLQTDYNRLDTLRKAGSIPQQQYDQIKTQYDLLKSNVAFLQQNTRLLAPFTGTVSGKYFENGEMFSGAPNTQAGKAAILSLVQTARLKALVRVSESYYPYIKQGMEVTITSDVYPKERFPGTISMLYPTIDPITRTFAVEILINNPQEKLRPGMFARAQMELEKVEAFVVPSLAILKLQGANERYVFINDNGTARRVVVEMGNRYDDRVEVISDQLKAGDQLIVAGHSRLLDGSLVNVQQ